MKKRVVFVVITAIVIALAIWIFLYYNGITGIPGTFSHVDIYCKDCLGKSALECKNTCQNHFDSVNAYLQGYSMKTNKIGDKSFTLCTCEGRIDGYDYPGCISLGASQNHVWFSGKFKGQEDFSTLYAYYPSTYRIFYNQDLYTPDPFIFKDNQSYYIYSSQIGSNNFMIDFFEIMFNICFKTVSFNLIVCKPSL